MPDVIWGLILLSSSSPTDPYLVTVTTLSGQASHFFVRPSELVADLKEKISLTQGIPVLEQRLVFMQNELHNHLTLHCSGVVRRFPHFL